MTNGGRRGRTRCYARGVHEPDVRPAARMSIDELADRSGTSRTHIEQLIGIGALEPGDDGTFDWNDVQRVSIVAAYEAAGIGVDDLAAALRDGNMTFAYSTSIYPPPSPTTTDTLAGVAEDAGVTTGFLGDVLLAMGLPVPAPEQPLAAKEAEALRTFLAGWTNPHLAADAAIRAARIAGLAAHRLTDGWVDLFLETVALQPQERLTERVEVLATQFFEPASRVAGALGPLVTWLVERHMERGLNRANVEFLEYALEQRGLRARGTRLPVVVFADLSDFTALTERAGDASAAKNAVVLGDLAVQASAHRGGRLVKQLGDGVLLVFDDAQGAIEAVRDLRRRTLASELPRLHVGVAAGPVVQRDGDVYGRTVNLASRISGAAASDEVLANETVASQMPEDFVTAGTRPLKGFEVPVDLFRLSREDSGRA
jgi:adenylate cyclase